MTVFEILPVSVSSGQMW